MVTQDEINGYFLEVIRFLKSEYGYTQEFIVEKAKLGKSAISKIKNGENNVGDKTISKLCDAFEFLNSEFFYGRSPYKTLPEKSKAAFMDQLKKTDEHNPPIKEAMPTALDFSIMIENAVKAATAYANRTIAALEKQVADKDAQVEDLRRDIIQRDKTIEIQARRIQELESYTNQHIDEDVVSKWPFKIGVADERQLPKEQV